MQDDVTVNVKSEKGKYGISNVKVIVKDTGKLNVDVTQSDTTILAAAIFGSLEAKDKATVTLTVKQTKDKSAYAVYNSIASYADITVIGEATVVVSVENTTNITNGVGIKPETISIGGDNKYAYKMESTLKATDTGNSSSNPIKLKFYVNNDVATGLKIENITMASKSVNYADGIVWSDSFEGTEVDNETIIFNDSELTKTYYVKARPTSEYEPAFTYYEVTIIKDAPSTP